MDNTRYNGYDNRETWLVNLHFGDNFQYYLQEEVDSENLTKDELEDSFQIGQNLSNLLDDMLEEDLDKLSSFLKDYIDFSIINWNELADDYIRELDMPEEEEEEEEEEE